MFALNALVLTVSLLSACESAYVDTLVKCSIKDAECLKGLYTSIMKEIGKSGVPELDIPPLDPIEMKNVSINILDAVIITVTEGTIKGMSNCIINELSSNIEKRKGHIDVSCDTLTIKGNFIVTGESPLVQSVIGGNNVNGNGKAKVKAEKVNMKLDYQLIPFKKDGKIYLKISNKGSKYDYDIGNAHFVTQNIMIANNDMSQLISDYLNQNWRSLMKSFGHIVVDKAMELYSELLQKFVDKIPADKLITEDLTQYV